MVVASGVPNTGGSAAMFAWMWLRIGSGASRHRVTTRPWGPNRPRRHAHRGRAGAGRRPDRDPVPAHTVRNATAGGIRDARTAGIRPANAPIRMAEAMPPDHASTGITTA